MYNYLFYIAFCDINIKEKKLTYLKAYTYNLFQISQDINNDTKFDHELIKSLIQISRNSVETINGVNAKDFLLIDVESLIFIFGTLKNLSNNTEIKLLLSQQGIIRICSRIIPISLEMYENSSNESKEESKGKSSTINYKKRIPELLIQIVTLLCNLSSSQSNHQMFWNENIIPQLINLFSIFITEYRLLFQISRVLCKLSLQEKARIYFNNNSNYCRVILRGLEFFREEYEFIDRICYILGNITTSNVNNRIVIGKKYFGSKTCLDLLIFYGKLYETNSNDNKLTDLLIKLIRLIANLSVSPEVSPKIINDPVY